MALSHTETLSCGIVLCAADRATELSAEWFDREQWLKSGARRHTSTGRAEVLISDRGTETWILRHYCRGGFVARFIDDHYFWLGLEQTRAFREWRLLERMIGWGLPSPAPVAACVRRMGLWYKADIITQYLSDTQTLSAYLREDGVGSETWQAIGRMIKQFHAYGVCHPDLTAHNILLDTAGKTYLVDFDSARVRPSGDWQRRGIARLQRSLRKVALETGAEFDPKGWRLLESAYREHEPQTSR